MSMNRRDFIRGLVLTAVTAGVMPVGMSKGLGLEDHYDVGLRVLDNQVMLPGDFLHVYVGGIWQNWGKDYVVTNGVIKFLDAPRQSVTITYG